MNVKRVAKAVAVYGLWPAVVTVAFLEWVHFPVVKSFSDWLKEFDGIWAALQGIGIPASIFMALHLPARQKRQEDLGRLVAHRNVAFFVERFVRDAIAPTLIKGEAAREEWIEGYKACMDELNRLDRSEINPPRLIEKFVDFASHAKQMMVLMERSSLSVEDKERVQRIRENLFGNIAVVDDYLLSQSVTFDTGKIAHI